MLLHTVNKSPESSDALASCLRSALPGALVLLLEDGVYAARRGSPSAEQMAALPGLRYYALEADVAGRGLLGMIAAEFELVEYADFVRLSIECHAVQSWY
jgi:tRNA 2-thiouridine synthesizing protein B